MEFARFLKSAFEFSLLGLCLVCLLHSLHAHGWRRTSREFTAGFVLTALCESLGVLSGAYVYPGFHWYVLATPVANPASWVATVYIVQELSNRLVAGQNPRRFEGLRALAGLAALDAALALAIDLTMDPLASVYNWWIWVPCAPDVTRIGPGVVDPWNFDQLAFLTTPDGPVHRFFAGFFPGGMRYPTRFLGVPATNFTAWFLFVFTFSAQFRWVETRSAWSHLRRSVVLFALVLADVPVLALALIVPNW